MPTHKIQVVTRMQDCGDGGYTMYAYNNDEEMLADHPLLEDGTLTDEEREALRMDILTEDDPYENGYIGKADIFIEETPDGFKLAKSLSLHVGQ